MSSRCGLPLSVAAAVGLALVAKSAHAQAVEPRQGVATQSTQAAVGSSLRGFDALATAGWGAHTGNILDLELAPYGASFGVDLGYSWSSGFRLGGYFFQSLGRGVLQPRESRMGRPYELNVDASSSNGGLSLGWGVPLYGLVLRYTLSLGVTAMRWSLSGDSTNPSSFSKESNPSLGFHFAPGVALLWPYRRFEGGIGFEYLAQIKDTIPSGVFGTLLLGVKL
jgi:hypothetical protein